MKIYCFLFIATSLSSLVVFAYMRNKQAKRIDYKRNKMEEKTLAIIELLQQQNP